MKRRLFNILAALSLVLCVATAGLWVRSYWYADSVAGPPFTMSSVDQAVFICTHSEPGGWHWSYDSSSATEWNWTRADYGATPDEWPQLRFPDLSPVRFEPYGNGTCRLVLGHWFLCSLTVVLPAIWLWRYRRDRRLRTDGMPHCAQCDYNLTGNVSGICPECGTPIAAQVTENSGHA